MDKPVVEIGCVLAGDRVVGRIKGLCIVENLRTLRSACLVSTEFNDGNVELSIVSLSEPGEGAD